MGVISTRRLGRFLSCSKRNPSCTNLSKAENGDYLENIAVTLRGARCLWSNDGEGQSTVLECMSLDLPKGILVAVVGEVSSSLEA
ncbi:hypothetical protein ACLOJK_028031 [Asimina triloba]